MAKKHIIVCIHGITPSRDPIFGSSLFKEFLANIQKNNSALMDRFEQPLFIEWGKITPNSTKPYRPDERLTLAENFIYRHTFDTFQKNLPRVKTVNDPALLWFLRNNLVSLRELMITAISDATYYVSAEGEAATREAVYGQFLDGLSAYKDDEIVIHLMMISFGCTIGLDFLYGLFAPDTNWKAKKPDFSANKRFGKKYLAFRVKAQEGTLQLGALVTMATQLPVTILRRQKLVDIFAEGKTLNPLNYGIKGDKLQWKSFFDLDDILSYSSVNLFSPNAALLDIQVRSSFFTKVPHDDYVRNPVVVKEVSSLLEEYSK